MKNATRIIQLNGLLIMFLCIALFSQSVVKESARTIPVCYTVDVVVAGGNLGGVAAALAAAQAGKTVLIFTTRESFCDEISAKSRLWLAPGEVPQTGLEQDLFGLRSNSAGYMFVSPGAYKKKIEGKLVAAGVQMLYWTAPTDVIVDGSGNVCGVVFANKSGRSAVLAKVVVDATQSAAVARMAGAQMTSWSGGALPVSFVKMIGHIDSLGQGTGMVLYNATDSLRVYTTNYTFTNASWPQRCSADSLLWKTFPRSYADMTSHWMHMDEPAGIVGSATENGAWSGGSVLSLDCTRPQGLSRIYVVSGASSVSRANAQQLIRPLELIRLGTRVGTQVATDAGSITTPSVGASHVKTITSGTSVNAAYDTKELLKGVRPFHTYPAVQAGAADLPVWGIYDLVIVGGGTAGASAAISASRTGIKVLVVEALGTLGGTGTNGVNNFYHGWKYGFNQSFKSGSTGTSNSWRPLEKAQWFFDEIIKAGGSIWFNTLGCGTVMDQNKVMGVVVASPMGRGCVLARRVIDATADGDISAFAGAQVNYVNNGDLAIQEVTYKAMDNAGNDRGTNFKNINVDPEDAVGYTYYYYLNRRDGEHKDQFDFFPLIGYRESRKIICDYVVTDLDLHIWRSHSDVIANANCRFDPHTFPDGPFISTAFTTTAASGPFWMPYRSLIVKNLDNLLVTGRCKSLTHDAQARVRVQADMMNEGFGAGYAAAQSIRTNVALRNVNISGVQSYLMADRTLDPSAPVHNGTQRNANLNLTYADLVAAAKDPRDIDNGTDLTNASKLLLDTVRSRIIMDSIFALAPTKAGALALCVLGSKNGVPYLCNWIDSCKYSVSFGGRQDQPGLPYFWETWNYYPIDTLEGAIFALGYAKDPRAITMLSKKLALLDSNLSYFNWSRAITMAMARIGDKSAIPALVTYLNKPGIKGHVNTIMDLSAQSQASWVSGMRELFTAGAILRCGDSASIGKNILKDYRDNDWRGMFVRYAGYLLETYSDSSTNTIATIPGSLPKLLELFVHRVAGVRGTHLEIYLTNCRSNVFPRVVIYTLSGKMVKTINTMEWLPIASNGIRTVKMQWDGSNTYGNNVADGVYIIKAIADNQTLSSKLTIHRK